MTLQDKRDEAKSKGVEIKKSDTIKQIQDKIEDKETKEQLKAGVVPEGEIAKWKRKYKKVHKITVEVSEGDIAIGYLRPPNRDHKAIALSLYSQNKILETGEFIIQNCWLGGDERLKNKEDIADSAAVQANSVVNFLKGSSEVI